LPVYNLVIKGGSKRGLNTTFSSPVDDKWGLMAIKNCWRINYGDKRGHFI